MRNSLVLGFAAGAALLSSAAPSLAADLPSKVEPPVFVQPDGYDVTIGAGPNVTNRFPGSKQVTVLPSLHFGYRKAGEPDPFYAPDDAFDIAIFQSPNFRIGPAGNYIQDRGSCCGFQGMHYVGGTVQLGGFVEFFPIQNHLRLRGEILQGVTGSRALTGNIMVDAIHRMGPFEFSLGPRFGFGDSRYANSYFSVTPAEAAANGLINPYNAQGGLTSVGGLGTVRYDLSRQYSLLGFGGYSRLVSSVGGSPVATRIGTRNQFTAGATLSYTFGFKGFGFMGY